MKPDRLELYGKLPLIRFTDEESIDAVRGLVAEQRDRLCPSDVVQGENLHWLTAPAPGG